MEYWIKVLINNTQKISLKITEEVYKNIDIEKLFVEATKLSTKFNFMYRGSYIEISLNKLNLDKHYIYYLYDLVLYINNNIK